MRQSSNDKNLLIKTRFKKIKIDFNFCIVDDIFTKTTSFHVENNFVQRMFWTKWKKFLCQNLNIKSSFDVIYCHDDEIKFIKTNRHFKIAILYVKAQNLIEMICLNQSNDKYNNDHNLFSLYFSNVINWFYLQIRFRFSRLRYQIRLSWSLQFRTNDFLKNVNQTFHFRTKMSKHKIMNIDTLKLWNEHAIIRMYMISSKIRIINRSKTFEFIHWFDT